MSLRTLVTFPIIIFPILTSQSSNIPLKILNQTQIFPHHHSSCLTKISQKYFQNETKINIFFQNSTDKSEIVKLFSNWTVEIYDDKLRRHSFPPIIFFKANTTVLILENVDRRIRHFRRNPTWDARSKILVLINGDEESAKTTMKTLWRWTKASNAVLVLNGDCGKFYSWKPFQVNDCNEVVNLTVLNIDDLFKKKDYRNLNGCNITVSTTALPPYIYGWNNLTQQYTKGIEVTIMTNLAKNFNSKIHYLQNQRANWDQREVNGTFQGAIGNLMRHEADIAFSYLILTYERFMNADGLVSHLEDEIVWFVPTPRPTINVQSLLYAFDKSIWIAISVIFNSTSALLYFTEKSISYMHSATKIMATLLNMPVKTKSRFPTLLSYILALHVITLYQFWMSLNLMIERTEKPIETFAEAADSKLFAYLIPSLRDYYNQTDFETWEKILRPGRWAYTAELYSRVNEIADKKTAIMLFPKLPVLHYVGRYLRDEKGAMKVDWLRPRFLSAKLTFYLSAGHPLTPFFNDKLMKLIESGIINYWVNSVVDMKKTYSTTLNYEEGSHKPVTMKNLRAGFYYIGAVYAVGVLVFAGEVVLGYFHRRYEKKSNFDGYKISEGVY